MSDIKRSGTVREIKTERGTVILMKQKTKKRFPLKIKKKITLSRMESIQDD